VKLRLLSYNIHRAIGVDRRFRPERVASIISYYHPDVVMLQEVDEGAPRSRGMDLGRELAETLGYEHYAIGHNVKLRKGRYGNATLSRWPLTHITNIDLTLKPKKRRGALYTRLRVRIGRHTRTLVVLNLHLGLAGFERSIQLKRLLKHQLLAGLHGRTPVLLAGDFNDPSDTLGPRLLQPAGFRRAGTARATYPAFWPLRPLDGIFVRGDLKRVRAWASRMDSARAASDHLPILADLSIGATGQART